MTVNRPLLSASSTMLDFASPEFINDPYPHYRNLRAAARPQWYEPLSAWLISRYHSCRSILRDYDAFSSDFRKIGLAVDPAALSLQTLDPPEQLAVRRPLQRALRASFTARLRESVEADFDRLLSEVRPRETIDFVSELAIPLATFATLNLIGLQEGRDNQEDGARLTRLSAAVVKSMMAGLHPDAAVPGAASRAELADLLDQRTKANRPAGFLRCAFDEYGLSAAPRDQALNSLRVVLLAGINSGQRYLSNGLLALLRLARGLEQLREMSDHELVLDELARYDGVVQAHTKVALRDVRIDGQMVRRGEQMVVLIGSANHDESVFADSERLMLERNPNPHLAFGSGPHLCFGAPVAKFLARCVLFTLAARYPRTELAGPAVRDQNPTLRGLLKLPIRLRE